MADFRQRYAREACVPQKDGGVIHQSSPREGVFVVARDQLEVAGEWTAATEPGAGERPDLPSKGGGKRACSAVPGPISTEEVPPAGQRGEEGSAEADGP